MKNTLQRSIERERRIKAGADQCRRCNGEGSILGNHCCADCYGTGYYEPSEHAAPGRHTNGAYDERDLDAHRLLRDHTERQERHRSALDDLALLKATERERDQILDVISRHSDGEGKFEGSEYWRSYCDALDAAWVALIRRVREESRR